MNQRELYRDYAKLEVKEALVSLRNRRLLLEQTYKKLVAQKDETVLRLMLDVDVAKVERLYCENKPKDIALADLKIKRTEAEFLQGKIKAEADFEIAYSNLKKDVEKSEITLTKDKIYLAFTEEMVANGFLHQ
jgi:hypothetical protein